MEGKEIEALKKLVGNTPRAREAIPVFAVETPGGGFYHKTFPTLKRAEMYIDNLLCVTDPVERQKFAIWRATIYIHEKMVIVGNDKEDETALNEATDFRP